MTTDPLLGNVGFIGAGALGTTLAQAMHRCGYRVCAVASRTAASAERLADAIPGCDAASPQEVVDRCDTVFLTVPDDAIADVAVSLRWRDGQSVVHCSGALPLDVLSPAAQSGAAATEAGAIGGAMHPLQTFTAGVDATAAFQGIACAIEAPAPLRGALDDLAARLGGWPISLSSEDRVLYHASAIAACGLVATLLKLAGDLWTGIPGLEEQGMRALLPLTRSTLGNIERQGLPSALTGPAARGDVGVVHMHLDALSDRAPGFLPLYAALSLASLPIAREKGTLAGPQEALLRELLSAFTATATANTQHEGAPCV